MTLSRCSRQSAQSESISIGPSLVTATQARVLAVEDAQRILAPGARCSSHRRRDVRGQMRAQQFDVRRATQRVTHGVDQESKARETDGLVKAMRQCDDLDVDGRIVGAEHFDAELVVLTVPTLPGDVRSGTPAAKYHAFHGVVGLCWMKARTTDAVPSGRSA